MKTPSVEDSLRGGRLTELEKGLKHMEQRFLHFRDAQEFPGVHET